MADLPLAATILRSTLEKFLSAKAAETNASAWKSLTFNGWRVEMTFDREVHVPDDVEFAVPGFIVADVASTGRKVEALLVEE